MCDYKVIQRHGEGQKKTGKYARHNIRKNDFEEGIYRGSPQIQRGLIGVFAGLLELGHDAKNHIGNIERDVGQ